MSADVPAISVMMLPGDAGTEVTVFEGDEPILDVSLVDMVVQFAKLEALDGKLHPYLDGTLNILSDMTYAILKVVEMMEEDDPHRAVLLKAYLDAYEYVRGIVRELTDD